MTLRIERNTDGSLKTNRSLHTADMFCDVCGTHQAGVNMNVKASYANNITGTHVGVVLKCSDIGGSCGSTTCWPLLNGTIDAIELAIVKTA